VPLLTIIAGPNGSGKSTLTQSVDFDGRDRLLDPDAVARALNPLNPSAAALAAGREVLSRIAGYLACEANFAVETTLAGKGTVELISRAKSRGYEVHLVLVWLDSAERCVARIRDRAAKGGHYIPDADVRRRYERGLANVPAAIRSVDLAKLYDNSGNGHRFVLLAQNGSVV
jgi:predicted ABC-type ATPase